MSILLRMCAATVFASLVIIVITGVLLSFYYVPYADPASSTSLAQSSIRTIEHDVVSGSVIRALHHNATSILVAVSLAWCALLAWQWRTERRIWLVVVGLVVIALVGAWTGRLLPDDQYAHTSRSVMNFGLREGHGGTVVGTLLGLRTLPHLALTTVYAMHAIVLLIAADILRRASARSIIWTKPLEQWTVASVVALAFALSAAIPPVVPGDIVRDVDPSRPWWMFLPLHHLSAFLGAELTSLVVWGVVAGLVSAPWWAERVQERWRRTAVAALALLFVALLLA